MKENKKKKTTKKKVFAEGFSFPKIFTFFVIGCLLGTYWEEILYYVQFHEVVNRQGVIYGPFSPIYGFGVCIFIIFLAKNDSKRPIWKTFLYSALLGGVSEYLASFIADKVFGIVLWDYSTYFLNINGRTTLPYMLFWGLGGTFLVRFAYPFVSKWIEKIPYKPGKIIFTICTILMAIDLFLTYGALGRKALRNDGNPPITIVGEMFDKYYDDDFLSNKFPVMRDK